MATPWVNTHQHKPALQGRNINNKMDDPKPKSDLVVLQEMAENNEKIAMSTNFISVISCKQGAKITMGTDDETMYKIMNDEVICALYIIDKKQFFKRKNQPINQ